MASSALTSQNPLLLNAAGALSIFPLGMGLIGAANPWTVFDLFKFARPTTPDAQKLAGNMMLFLISRDLFMGSIGLVSWYTGDKRTMGIMFLAAITPALSDGVAAIRQNPNGEGKWLHFGFVPVLAGLGGGLLGWFDGL